MAFTLAELARQVGGRVQGASDYEISGVAALDRAGPQHIAYLSERKYRHQLATSRAGAVIMNGADAAGYAGNALVVESPHLCFARVAALLHPATATPFGVHATALVDPQARIAATCAIGAYTVVEAGATIGDGARIGPGCYIGRDVMIGPGTRLVGHVWIGERSVLGRDCTIYPGVVIGADGFGYAKDGERWVKVPQLGRIVIGNDVEVGANTTIDRGALGDTVIGDGVKLDNLIQIGHNVRIGEHSILAGCVGVAGSATIGRRCAIGGQVGIAGHLEIADDVQVLGTSLVAGSITEAGTYSSAIGAQPADKWRRNAARVRQLDELVRRVHELEQEVRNLHKGESS
jgi:UDP-3-O-[3-hydroxymyristoyl] glucosamine N-acyltransferase